MDFSPNSMMKDIQNAIQMSDAKNVSGRDRKVLNRRKLLHMQTTYLGEASRNNSLLDRGGSSHEVAAATPLDEINEESHKGGANGHQTPKDDEEFFKAKVNERKSPDIDDKRTTPLISEDIEGEDDLDTI